VGQSDEVVANPHPLSMGGRVRGFQGENPLDDVLSFHQHLGDFFNGMEDNFYFSLIYIF